MFPLTQKWQENVSTAALCETAVKPLKTLVVILLPLNLFGKNTTLQKQEEQDELYFDISM